MATIKPTNVDEYIASFPEEIQKFLKQIRGAVKNAAPKAEESISYNMPMYKWKGMLVSFAAWKKHVGLYPTPSLTAELRKKLTPYEGAKSTLRFPLDKALPTDLITKVVKLRLKENQARIKSKLKKKK